MPGSHVPEQVQRSIAQALDQPPAAIRIEERRPLNHQSNRLYDAWAGDRHLIVKEFLKPDELHDAPLREARAFELVAPLDIAPRLVLLQPSATPALGPVVVYEWIGGDVGAALSLQPAAGPACRYLAGTARAPDGGHCQLNEPLTEIDRIRAILRL